MSEMTLDTEEFNIQNVRWFYTRFAAICLAPGTFLNVLVLWLVCTQSHGLLASFKALMVQHSVLELVSLLTAVLVQPLFNFVHGRFVMVHNGPLRNVAQPTSFVLTEAWFAILFSCIVSNVLQFVYRYLLICRNIKLTLWRYMTLLTAGCCVASAQAVLHYFAVYPREPPTEEYRQTVNRYLGLTSEERQAEISLMGQTVMYPCIIHCFYLLALEALCIATVVFCTIKIRRAVNDALKVGQMEQRKADTERQLTVALILQVG